MQYSAQSLYMYISCACLCVCVCVFALICIVVCRRLCMGLFYSREVPLSLHTAHQHALCRTALRTKRVCVYDGQQNQQQKQQPERTTAHRHRHIGTMHVHTSRVQQHGLNYTVKESTRAWLGTNSIRIYNIDRRQRVLCCVVYRNTALSCML